MMRGDQKVEDCDVPVFQLLQWKFAIKLEAKGMRHSSGRSVAKHARIVLGLPPRMKREAVIARIDEILKRPMV